MVEWYLDEKTNRLTRLCESEEEHIKMRLRNGLVTPRNVYLYHEKDFGIGYPDMLGEDSDYVELMFSSQVREMFKDDSLVSITSIVSEIHGNELVINLTTASGTTLSYSTVVA